MASSHEARTSFSTDVEDTSSFDKLQVESPPDCEIEEPELRSLSPKPWWKRVFGAIFPGSSAHEGSGFLPLVPSSDALHPSRPQSRSRRFIFSYWLLIPTLGFFVMLWVSLGATDPGHRLTTTEASSSSFR
jgi:hypothetical protein